ncbi:hypothetical protein CERZMDRAFT_93939 [Cercospora zeae-maydis SCOH1-5]|uniref:Uncharacterized protein n=1 Tax=Cercospora zeae-maydis SCOH1-5 TaxID=717836 RepID=A0A6A6FTE2_9PEZI|nr:hypothetical protein CERZMDRAFT_93939 [Cercospora zeae-maydis SCOH1-5]
MGRRLVPDVAKHLQQGVLPLGIDTATNYRYFYSASKGVQGATGLDSQPVNASHPRHPQSTKEQYVYEKRRRDDGVLQGSLTDNTVDYGSTRILFRMNMNC